MNQPAAVRPDAPAATRRTLGVGVATVVLAIVATLAVTYVVGLSSGPSTVARLTFENPTEYALDIEVGGEPGTGWTSAGSVAQRSSAVVEEVIDQGHVWIFRFRSQGRGGGEVRIERAELERSGWRIEVPVEVGKRLRESGAPPTP